MNFWDWFGESSHRSVYAFFWRAFDYKHPPFGQFARSECRSWRGTLPGTVLLECLVSNIFIIAIIERLKEEKKLKELMKAVRKLVFVEKDDIVLQSQDVEDCVDKMRIFVDKCVEEFVEGDDFFNEIPHRASDKIKSELEPIFRTSFENMKVMTSFLFVYFLGKEIFVV